LEDEASETISASDFEVDSLGVIGPASCNTWALVSEEYI
jgi:hypothetical protein